MNRGARNLKGYWVVAAVFIAVAFGSSTVRSQAQESKATVKLSHKELVELIKNAKEPADHEKLAAYYRAKAEEAKAIVTEHQQMLAAYNTNPSTHNVQPAKSEGGPVAYCQTLIRVEGEEEKADLDLADYHEKMAKAAGNKQ